MANKLLWSVRATAGIPAADTAAINSGTRTIPSTREYSVCNRKWTNCLKGLALVPAAQERMSAGARDRAHAAREAAGDQGCSSPCESRKNMRDIVYPCD